jgi:hypothetical protein
MATWVFRLLIVTSLFPTVLLEEDDDFCQISISAAAGEYDSSEVWFMETGIDGHWSSGHRLTVIDGPVSTSVLLVLAVHGCRAADSEQGCTVILEAKGPNHEPYFKNEALLSWLSPARSPESCFTHMIFFSQHWTDNAAKECPRTAMHTSRRNLSHARDFGTVAGGGGASRHRHRRRGV